MTAGTPLLEVRDLCKQFPGVKALDRVSMTLRQGEVLAVIGENGAGKSTLMKILAGAQQADSGEIALDGGPVRVGSVAAAQALGIALIHQELNLADNLDVGANLFLGREPHRFGLIDRGAIVRDSKVLLDRLGLDVSPQTIVSTLSIGHQQMVEIGKALAVRARVLIMDEPTSSLSQRETEHLYAVIRGLKVRGVGIVYISHRLGEVKELADRVEVLRDGANAGRLEREEINHGAMVRLMVGRDIAASKRGPRAENQPVVLSVEDLRTLAHPRQSVSFSLRAGEVVGIAGLVGAGRTELLETLFGVCPPVAGSVTINGRSLAPRRPKDAIRAGMALVPEDRKLQGLVLEMAVRENISLASLRAESRGGLLPRRREQALGREMIDRLGIKTPSDRQTVQLLSGGNQQKIVLAKWLAIRPRVLLLDEPTRGIDVGAKREIYRLMEELSAQGVAILFVSSELEEILTLSDRALVMCQGRISGELASDSLTEEAVMRLATAV